MVKSKTIVIIGPPGSGKSTLSRKLANIYGYTLYSCSDLYQQEKISNSLEFQALEKTKTLLGIHEYRLKLNDFIMNRLKSRININDNIVIEGFKDNDLLSFSREIRTVDLVIILHGDNDVLVNRILHRNDNREDDNYDTAMKRINIYYKYAYLISNAIEYLKIKHVTFDVDKLNIDNIIEQLNIL